MLGTYVNPADGSSTADEVTIMKQSASNAIHSSDIMDNVQRLAITEPMTGAWGDGSTKAGKRFD